MRATTLPAVFHGNERCKILVIALRILKTVFIGCCAAFSLYLLIITGVVVWMFEVKLKRWPMFVYGAPFSAVIGDDIEKIGFKERLERLGYTESSEVIPPLGQWSLTGSILRIYLAHSPISGRGIVSGPVELSLDWKRIEGIRLLRAQDEVGSLTIEPELLEVFPGRGSEAELCRYLPLDQVNPLLVDAVLLTEDTRFFSHQGVDPSSMVDAVKANLKAWKYLQGASTVTQQLVRMTVLTPKKTMVRKLNEMALALVADLIYRKETILEAYLNRVYLGQWASYPVKGVGEASRLYFGKDQQELCPAEVALMAAVIRAPNVITPLRHPDRALGRRNMVIGLLFKSGKIDREAYDHALSSPIAVRKSPPQHEKVTGFLNEVRALTQPEHFVGADGRPAQDVVTSLDPLLQRNARKGLSRFGRAGREGFVIVADPRSGALSCLVTPSSSRWDGSGGNTELFSPILLIPALAPQPDGRPAFTLSKPVDLPGQAGEAPTFRKAFSRHKALLMERVIGYLGLERSLDQLRAFGVTAEIAGKSNLRVLPMAPRDVAQIFALLAASGNAGLLSPGVVVVGRAPIEKEARKTVQVDPVGLFIVNHLLKGIDAVVVKERNSERGASAPSIMEATDETGLWRIAYRDDVLLLLRLKGADVKEKELRQYVDNLLPRPTGPPRANPPPAGIVFSKVCAKSGLRALSLCPNVINESFVKGTEPSEWCPLIEHGH